MMHPRRLNTRWAPENGVHVLQPPSMTLFQRPSRRSPGLGSPRAPDAPTRRRRGYPLRHARPAICAPGVDRRRQRQRGADDV